MTRSFCVSTLVLAFSLSTISQGLTAERLALVIISLKLGQLAADSEFFNAKYTDCLHECVDGLARNPRLIFRAAAPHRP